MPRLKELPRLTNYLRAHSDVVAPWAGDYVNDSDALLQKRRETTEKQVKLCNLKSVKEFLYQNSSHSPKEIDGFISELMILAKEIVGDGVTTLVLEGAVIHIIELFRSCSVLGQTHCLALRRTYGAYPHTAVARAFTVCRQIADSIHSSAYDAFVTDGFPRLDEGLMTEEFGSKIRFADQGPLDESFFSAPVREAPEKGDAFEGLSFAFNPPPPREEEPKSVPAQERPKVQRYNQQWLEEALGEMVQTNPDALSPAELTVSVVQLLKSNKSSEELQNELFDFLGFESFELIQNILCHRDDLVFSKVIDTNVKDSVEKRPTCMTQVVIQSETERLLNKQIRKDEKKILKEISRTAATDDINSTRLDPARMKQFREEALLVAQNKPIFCHLSQETMAPFNPKYPNVFDLYAEMTMSAAFIAGRKLALPENSQRTNNSMYEEIKIPATKNIYDQMTWDLVEIENLDKTGQEAFKGVERLNCIQSKVFWTAYNTNHNMLVCAPTGAGKTNVAMLTIVHEIKNNIENGAINKNKFKILHAFLCFSTMLSS